MKKKIITTIGVITAILSLFGGIWAFESHYATNDRVDEKFERIEIVVAGALQNSQIKSDIKFYQFMYDKLTQDMITLRRKLREQPNDSLLRDDYNETVRQRNDIKRKIEELMRKIN